MGVDGPRNGRMLFLIIAVLLEGSFAAQLSATVVHPKLLESRSDSGEHVVRLTEEITMNLRPSTVLADRIEYADDDGSVLEDVDARPYKKDLYEDPRQMSSVIMRTTQDGVILKGVLQNKYFIRPTNAAERSDDGQIAHRIQKIPDEDLANYAGFNGDEGHDALQPTIQSRDEVSTDEEPLPNNVTFELYVVSDTKHHKIFPKRKRLFMYLALFFNSVNYYLGSMDNPKVQVRVVGIRRTGRSATQTFIVKIPKTPYVNIVKTMCKFGKYTKKNKLSRKADLVLLLTGYDLVDAETSSQIHGTAYPNGLCTTHSLAIVEDRPPGFYQGTRPAAHGIGLLLGASQDTAAMGCPPEQGFLMSEAQRTDNYYKFSNCSKAQIRNALRKKGKSCWGSSQSCTMGGNDAQFPGAHLTMEDFCRRMFPNVTITVFKHKETLNSTCRFACCYPKNTEEHYCRPFDSLDGMPCEDGKVCLGGICTARSGKRFM